DLGTVTFARGVRLAGRVLDRSGAGVPDVEVKADDVPFGARWTKTDAAGTFALEHFPAAPESLRFEKEGYSTVLRTVDGAVEKDLEVRLLRPGTLAGVVLGVDGKPTEASIQVRRPGAKSVRRTHAGVEYDDYGADSDWLWAEKGTFEASLAAGKWIG